VLPGRKEGGGSGRSRKEAEGGRRGRIERGKEEEDKGVWGQDWKCLTNILKKFKIK
jgi:hypothetical protein